MKNILVATDFTENSRPALETAVYLASRNGAVLHLLHTYLPVYPMTETVTGPPLTVEWEETYRTSAQEQMDRLTEELKARNVTVTPYLELGPLTSIVKEFTEEKAVDMVIMGRTESSDSSNWFTDFFGNSSTQLFNELNVPLLVVPGEVEEYGFTRIAYATQLEFNESEAIRKTFRWADSLGAAVQLINVQSDREPNIASDDEMLTDIQTLVPEHHITLQQRKSDSVEEGILDLLKDTEADLLVMSTHHRNLFTQIVNPSKSKKLLLRCPVPVLLFPLKEID